MRTSEILLEWKLTDGAYRARVEAAAGPVDRWQETTIPIVEVTAAARLALITLVTPVASLTSLPFEEAIARPRTRRGVAVLPATLVLELPGERDDAPDAGAATAAILAALDVELERERTDARQWSDAAAWLATAHAAVLPERIRRGAAEGRDVRPALRALVLEVATAWIRQELPPAVGYLVPRAEDESPRMAIPTEAAYAVSDYLGQLGERLGAQFDPMLPGITATVGPIARFKIERGKRTGARLTLAHPWLPGGAASLVVIAEPEPTS